MKTKTKERKGEKRGVRKQGSSRPLFSLDRYACCEKGEIITPAEQWENNKAAMREASSRGDKSESDIVQANTKRSSTFVSVVMKESLAQLSGERQRYYLIVR